jgi:uncharacterized protein (TIGR03067 family)
MLAWVVMASSLALGETPKGVEESSMKKKLQGTWRLTAQEHGGKKSTAKEIANLTLEVSKSRFTSRDGDDVKEEAELSRLDSSAKPAELDLKITAGPDRDKVVKGVWKLDRDELTVCIAEPGRERPKEFKGAEGTGHTLLVFRRAKK